QVVDQLIDVSDERRRRAGRQLERTRLARLVEVVDVDPVAGRLQALAFSLQVTFDEGKAPGARLAHDVHVVARTRHRHAELQRLELFGTDKVELFGRERPGQRIGRQAQAGGNAVRHQ